MPFAFKLKDISVSPDANRANVFLSSSGRWAKSSRTPWRLLIMSRDWARIGKIREAKEIHLEKAEFGHVSHVVLRHESLLALLSHGLQRRVSHQRVSRDYDASRVSAGVPGKSFQFARRIDETSNTIVVLIEPAQFGVVHKRPLQRDIGVPEAPGVQHGLPPRRIECRGPVPASLREPAAPIVPKEMI